MTPYHRVFSKLVAAIVVLVAVANLILFLFAGLAGAQTSPANYSFVVASGFLCNEGDSSGCPAVAKSAIGDSYEVSGAGTFDAQNKSAKAAGTFNHKSTNGELLETGVWTASALISFDSYGIAPAAFRQSATAFGGTQIGNKRMPMRPSPLPSGGLAKFRIQLVPVSGPLNAAVLEVNCALGDVPRERSVEGIRITLERNNSEYWEAGGRVIFLALRTESSMPAKMPEQKARPEASEQPQR